MLFTKEQNGKKKNKLWYSWTFFFLEKGFGGYESETQYCT